MEELRSWFEVPSIAHFCSLFRAAFDLPDFDIEDLEDGLHSFCEDLESPFIIDLICRLLRGCYCRTDIESYNYEVYLKDIFKYRASLGDQTSNPLEMYDFKSLDLREKVMVIYRLCDYRLDAEDVMEQLKGLDGDNMRVAPLGMDDGGATFWYFYGNRLYKEDPEPVIKEEKTKKKKKEKDKVDKKETKSKTPAKATKRKGKKKKEEETPSRSARGRILSKKKKYPSSESSEAEEEDDNEKSEESSEEEQVTPAKQQKSTPKGRQTRSTRKSTPANKTIEETPTSQGTRRSSRRSSAQNTPATEQKTRKGRGKKNMSVNGNVSDDSDEDWDTPLSKSVTKSSTRGKNTRRNTRQVASLENSEEEMEEETQLVETRKKGKPRNAVKITPASSVNGDVQDQDMDDVNEDSGIEEELDTSSTRRRVPLSKAQSNRTHVEEKIKEENEEEMETESSTAKATSSDTNPQDTESQEKEQGNSEENECSTTKNEEAQDMEIDGKTDDLNAESDKGLENKDSNDDNTASQTTEENANNNCEGNQESIAVKEEMETELNSNSASKNDSNKTDDELNVTDVKSEPEPELVDVKPPVKPLYKNPRWHLVCETLEQWQTMSESLKDSTTKAGKELFKCITNDFLPEIPAILEARERDKRERQAEMAPRRISARITMKMKEFQIQTKILEEARQLEDQQMKEEEEERERMKEIERQEEERRLREERQKAREERQKRLEQREVRAQYIAEGKEIPPELMYTGNSMNSKYVDDDRVELDQETLDDMEKLLDDMKQHKDSWPFVDPVDEEIAPGYSDVIKKPMDMTTIEKKLEGRAYRTTKRFIGDFNLMINNCFQFSGVDSELGRMATRLRKYLNKCIKIYLDKTGEDDDDDDFYSSGVATQVEQKYRPRRAATRKAMDTIRGAFDDDKFEEETASTPGHEYASTRKRRLIPELSGDNATSSPSKAVFINGEKPLNNKTDSAVSKIWAQSTEEVKETKILTVNGKTFVYKFNTPATNAQASTKRKLVEKLAYAISTSPDGKGQTVVPSVVNTVTNTTTPNSPRIVVRPPMATGSPAILPVGPTGTMPTTATINTPNGPKIIRIMSPAGLAQGQKPQAIASTTPAKAIRISDGMLMLDGKPTGIQISGKTKIIYKGAVTGTSTATSGQNAILVAGAQPRATNPVIIQNSGSQQIISTMPAGVQGSVTSAVPSPVVQMAVNPSSSPTLTEQIVANVPAAIGNQGQVIANYPAAIGNQGQVFANVPTVIGSQGQVVSNVQAPVSPGQVIANVQVPVDQGQGQIIDIQRLLAQRTNLPTTSSITQVIASTSSPGRPLVIPKLVTTGSKTVLVSSGGAQSLLQTINAGLLGQKVNINSTPVSSEQTIQMSAPQSFIGGTADPVSVTPGQTILVAPPSQPVVNPINNGSVSMATTISNISPPSALTNQNTQSTLLVNSANSSLVATSNTSDLVLGHIPSESVDSDIGQATVSSSPNSVSQNSILQISNESPMGPPQAIPPKRKLSGSPNKSILPNKIGVLGSPISSNNSVHSENSILSPTRNVMDVIGDTDNVFNCDSDQKPLGQKQNNLGDVEKFPPYKVSHSTAPNKGNLFDNLKNNTKDSTNSQDTDKKLTSDSNQSGLIKGNMDKVSAFAASLQSKTLSGKINIPAHMLQKSPTKDDQKTKEAKKQD